MTVHAGGAAQTVALADGDKRLVGTLKIAAPGHAIAMVSTVSSSTEMQAAEFHQYLEEEGLTHAIERRAANGETAKLGRERYSKCAKAILVAGDPGEGYDRLTDGVPIEIVPMRSPSATKRGDVLPIRVVFRGAPAADVQVRAFFNDGGKVIDKVLGRTNVRGELDVTLEEDGPWLLHGVLMERRDGNDVDWESYWASLTFEVPGD